MSRYTRSTSGEAWFPVVILVGAAAWVHRAQLVYIAYILLGIVSCTLVLKLFWKLLRNYRHKQFKDIDKMDGLEFERYVVALLRANGFHNVSLTEKYDFGVDIIAEKAGIRWGIQTKRQSGLVKASAVRQVVAGLRLYHCDRAMVITNSTYSSVAYRLADTNDCVLIDRSGLRRLIQQESIL